MSQKIYDFIGIGVGPFNLGLACLTGTIDNLDCLFLDKSSHFDWHPGMMLNESTLQTPFLSDLVTLADPTHPLSFLNYAKSTGKIYSFYIKEDFFLMRREYNQYCQWACQQLKNLQFNCEVKSLEYSKSHQCYRVIAVNKHKEITYLCKKLVIGTGPKPFIPDCCKLEKGVVIHSTNYLNQKQQLQSKSKITLVGSGQSAAEIFYDLLQDIDNFNYQLYWFTRSPRFFPLEYTKLTLEMTSPEYVDYFYHLPKSKREALLSTQKNLFKGINSSLINDIFDLLYIKKLNGNEQATLMTNTSLKHVSNKPIELDDTVNKMDTLKLKFYHTEQEKSFSISSDALVLATGYQYQIPDFLLNIKDRINWGDNGNFLVDRNYTIDQNNGEVFVQNAEIESHGFVTPDLGMACYRNSIIIREILGQEYYPIESKIAFQNFGVNDAFIDKHALNTAISEKPNDTTTPPNHQSVAI